MIVNIVGLSLNPICQSVRLFHSSSKYKDDVAKTLYEDRIAPVKLFDSELIDSLDNLTSIENKKLFFDKYKEKGGIYLIKYKEDENIYYIGRAKDFKNRLSTHLKTKSSDKFHLFANLVG